ncbi:MAG: hypothetical protein RBS37_01725 [Bacteroidales bacterium]|jgi:hypothetical protein|nr:hypothetical protein [Bacteroidales bacterium]
MELFKTARIRAGNRKLARMALRTNRSRAFLNLAEVKSIAILWDISNADDLAPISDFILQMSERGIKVDILGFFQGKTLPDKLTAIRYLECLKREDYSFFFRPKPAVANRFMEAGYEVLIEICFRDNFPLRYVSTLSAARMKIGPAFKDDKTRSHIDMLIDTGIESNVKEYLRQVIIYLEMINK